MASEIVAVWEGVLTVMGISLRVYVLSNGKRVIHTDDFHSLLLAMGDPDRELTEAEAKMLARFIAGDKLENHDAD